MIYNQRMSENRQNQATTASSADKQQRLYAGLNQSLMMSDFGGSAAEAHGIAAALCCRNMAIAEVVEMSDTFNFNDQVLLLSVQKLNGNVTTQP